MALPVEKVEVGFDTSFSGAGNYFTLDNATKGELDNASYPLAGLYFVDITSRVRSVSISRGRSNAFAQFPAGQVSIELNNHDRAFDPLYALSPYAGNIIPRREIKITSGTAVQFIGWIDDWNFSYTPNGDSVAEAIAYDATGILSGQTLSAGTPSVELSGTRIETILDEINWSPEQRAIDPGHATLSDYPIDEGTNVITYLQNVAASEPGLVFVGRQGKINFIDRQETPTSASLLYLGGTGIPFQNLAVTYGSENLYNQITVSRSGGGTATAIDLQSISDYGARDYSENGLLLSSDAQLVDQALFLAEKYGQPDYRFESLEVAIHKLGASDQTAVLNSEIGSIAKVTFTPNDIGDAIERYVQIIRINQQITTQAHYVEFGFQDLTYASLILDDAEFGRLNTYSLSW